MAARSFARSMKEELTCPICLDIFVEPKILPGCAHVCCEVCISQMLWNGITSIDCPECREKINITLEGVSELKTNFRLRNMANNHSREGDIAGAQAGVAICANHEGERMHLYCVQCNVLVCQLCWLESHNGTGHNVVGVGRKFKEQKVAMDALLQHTCGKIEKEKQTLQKIKDQMEVLGASQEKEQKRIDDFIQQQTNAFAAHGLALQADLIQAGKKKQEELQHQLTSVEEQISETENEYDLVLNTLNNEPTYTYATLHESFVYKLTQSSMKIPETRPISQAVPKLILTTTGNSVKGSITMENTSMALRPLIICCLAFIVLIFMGLICLKNEYSHEVW